MATPTKPNSRLGTYVVKIFKDESFRATCHRHCRQTHRWLSNRFRRLTRLPEPSAGDVFFDLEGDPFVAPQ
jgi:hypothetical protein